MPQPVEVTDLVEQLLKLFRGTQASIDEQVAAAATDPATARRRRRLAELRRSIDAELAGLEADTAGWLQGNLPHVYELGGAQGASSVGDAFSWTQIHVDAVQHLATDLYGDVLQATSFVRDDVKAWIRESSRRETSLALLEGRTAEQAGRELARAGAGEAVGLLGRPVGQIQYADGSYRTLADYSQMLIRTKSAQCYNAGTLNTLSGFGVEWCEILDGAGCGLTSHDDGNQANGQVVSIKVAADHPLSHPNCRRSFIGRPDVTNAREAKDAKRSTTDAQRADQIQAERDRAETVARRRTARERQARTSRSPRTPRAPRASVPATPTTGPAPGSLAPSEVVEYSTPDARRFETYIDQVGQLHGVPDNGLPTTIITTGKAKNRGGKFAPSGRKVKRKRGEPYAEFQARRAAARSEQTMEIRVNDRGYGDGDQAVSFLHEFGHRVDYLGRGNYMSVAAAGAEDEAVRQAFLDFLSAARDTPTIKDAYKNFGRSGIGYVQYFRSTNEIWARAYSQWAANELGGVARGGIEAMQARNRYQWPDDEFATVGPLVANVLRSRGLML